jgi:RHS repeat-associated protein
MPTSTDTASYVYDNNGNLTSKSTGTGTTQFQWDYDNRLTQVVTPSSGSATYKYDALGRRIQRAPSNGASANFTYDDQDVVRDKNSDGTTVDYLNGPGVDNKIWQKGATQYYFSEDHLGSTTALTSTSGLLVERETYDAYGNTNGSSITRYGYTGRERDSLTGLQYNRARFYDPQMGRFISEDPIGLSGGVNQFAYVHNNPQNGTDPSGLYESDVHYYLTYYLVKQMGCFSDAEARLIADADQATDENKDTKPGPGLTARQRWQNARFHALHPGAREGVGSLVLWQQAIKDSNNYVGLGRYLHYLQDTFSHSGYDNAFYGHVLDLHYVDKTDNDVEKTVRMAQSTWYALQDYARLKKKCGCREWSDASWSVVRAFARASGGPDYREIDWYELEIKRQILNAPLR